MGNDPARDTFNALAKGNINLKETSGNLYVDRIVSGDIVDGEAIAGTGDIRVEVTVYRPRAYEAGVRLTRTITREESGS